MQLTESLIRSKILNGELPATFNGSARASYGQGHTCALCGEKIDASRVEYEIECFNTEGAIPMIRLDGECFQAWLSEANKKN